MFTQGCTTEERYFFRMSVLDTPIHLLILNSTKFFEYLSRDCRENAHIIEITADNCVPNKFGVKYHHLLSGFVESDIFSHIFNAVSLPTVTLADLGVCRDLLEISAEPLLLTYGPNDQKVDEDLLKQINAVGGMGIYEIEFKLTNLSNNNLIYKV